MFNYYSSSHYNCLNNKPTCDLLSEVSHLDTIAQYQTFIKQEQFTMIILMLLFCV